MSGIVGEGSGYTEILIYAAIAAFVLFRLWSVLGRRDDNEQQRQNPFVPTTKSMEDPDREGDVVVLSDSAKKLPPPGITSSGNAADSLAGILEQIKNIIGSKDSSFDEKQFLQGARVAFKMIVENFARGDLERIENLLAPAVLKKFRQVVEERTREGKTQECNIVSITVAEVARARIDGQQSFITVDFTSMQKNVTRDASGAVIDGDPDKVEEIRDAWTFSRNLYSTDPNWQLVETE